jgi:hypothetical protein
MGSGLELHINIKHQTSNRIHTIPIVRAPLQIKRRGEERREEKGKQEGEMEGEGGR